MKLPNQASSSLLEWALRYAEHGWPVFPLHHIKSGACSCSKSDCISPGKHPRTTDGLDAATRERRQIIFWWQQRWPEANIGILCGRESDLLAVDIDPKHGGDDSFAALESEHGKIPDTPQSHTGSGGLHHLFKFPEVSIGPRANVQPGIDIRGERGYIVAPPSNHFSGNSYVWDVTLDPFIMQRAELPLWLIEVIAKSRTPDPKEYKSRDWDGVIPGRAKKWMEFSPKINARFNRNREGLNDGTSSGVDFSLACLLARKQLTGSEIEETIRASRCAAGLREKAGGDNYYKTTVGKALALVEEDASDDVDDIEAEALQVAFSKERTEVSFLFDGPPATRSFLIEGFLPDHESGLVIAAGGTGKGHLMVLMTLAMVLGRDFGPFSTSQPRGVVIVSAEDDREEMKRRFHAALDLIADDWRMDEEIEFALTRRLAIVDVRGRTNVHLGEALRGQICRVVERVEDPGLIHLDPLGRMLPDLGSGSLNDQHVGGMIVNELDAIRNSTGCMPLSFHHANKASSKDGTELSAGAATGSKMLSDLSRYILAMKSLGVEETQNFGLPAGHYVRADVVKTNYTPPLSRPLVLERHTGGALKYVSAKWPSEQAEDDMIAALSGMRRWVTRDEWEKEANEQSGIGKNKARSIRVKLETEGKIEQMAGRAGAKYFAMPRSDRGETHPDRPPQ